MSEFDLEKYSAYKDALKTINNDSQPEDPAAVPGTTQPEEVSASEPETMQQEAVSASEPETVHPEAVSVSEPEAGQTEEAPENDPVSEAMLRYKDVDSQDAAAENLSEKPKKNPVTGVFEWFESAIFAVVVVIMMFTFVFRIVGIDGRSMVPTLQNADRVIISDLFYTPKTGDIVVLDTSEDMIYFNGRQYSKPLIKRVIATGGQTVKVEDAAEGKQTVFVDGVPLQEDYINFRTVPTSPAQSEITVPEGYIFVMGDNRGESLDSRVFGCITEDSIVGRALFRIFPISEFGTVN